MITFVVALKSEARAIIEHFGLSTLLARHPYRIVGNDRLRLVISGIGKAASAAAASFCAGQFQDSIAGAWINVGIAGHREHSIGTSLLAHKIIDAASTRCWHPPILFDTPCETTDVATFDTPNLDYPERTACDMEAAGFIEAVSRLSSPELIHVIKVVSDTISSNIEDITRERIVELIESALPSIDSVTRSMERLLNEVPPAIYGPEIDELIGRWHFSEAQRLQLMAIARRWSLLTPNTPWPHEELDKCNKAAQILKALSAHLKRGPAPAPDIGSV